MYSQTKNKLSVSTPSKVIVLQTCRHTDSSVATENITAPEAIARKIQRYTLIEQWWPFCP